MWIFALVPIIPIIYIMMRKKPPSNMTMESDKKITLPPTSISENVKKEDKKKFKEAPTFGVPIAYQKMTKLLLFCYKTDWLKNVHLAKWLAPYIALAQNKKLQKKNLKFYPAPSKLIDYEKAKNIVSEYEKKFKVAKLWSDDKKQAEFFLNDVAEYLDIYYELVDDDVNLKDEVDFVLTDNLNIIYLAYQNFKKKRIKIKSVISNDDKMLSLCPKEIPILKYSFEKFAQKSGLGIPIIDEIMQKIDEYMPDKIKKIAKELRAGVMISSITGSIFAAAVVYVGQKINESKFNSIASEMYGIAGAIIAGKFSLGVGAYPAYRISKAVARYMLEGGNIQAYTKEILSQEDIKNLLKGELSKSQEYDFISFIEV